MMLRSPETPRLTAVLEEVVDALRAYEPEQIILYGSLARGDAGEFSDIDLIVVKETIDTRYPDPGTHVFKDYQPEEAREMLDHAVKIVSLVRSRIPPLDSSAAVAE